MSVPPGFLAFWDVYPRKVCKQAALDAYIKCINAGIDINLMLDAIRWQAANTFAGRPLDKIPHASTWLNGKRWEDERQVSLVPRNGHTPARNFREETTADAFARARAARGGEP